MAVKASEIIGKVYLYMEDYKRERLTSSEVLSYINDTKSEHLSSRNVLYARRFKQELTDGETIYAMPDDLVRATHLYMNLFDDPKEIEEGNLNGYTPSSISDLAIYRERVSSNEYELLPVVTGDVLVSLSGSSGNITRGTLPNSGLLGDVWVDDDGLMYRCSSAYSVGKTYLNLTSGRSVPLAFVAVEETAYIELSVTNAGATGTSALVVTGAGTFASPYVYALSLFEDDSSNDSIIALFVGDLNVTVTGADATVVTIFEYGDTPFQWEHKANFTSITLEIHYRAELPDFFGEDDELHPSVPNPLRSGDAIAKLTAAKILNYMKQDERKANLLMSEGIGMLSESRFQSNRRIGAKSFSARGSYW